MNTIFPIIALALLLGFTISASAIPLSDIPSAAPCDTAGGVWDREADKCVAKESHRACELRDGTLDEGSSTCSVPQ